MGRKVNRFRDIHLRSCAGILWVLHKMFEWMWEQICLFPRRSCAMRHIVRLHGSRRFGNVSWYRRLASCALPLATTAKEVNVCHLRKRVIFGLHHESNTSTHFNCSELSTSSDGLYGAVFCSRDTAYALLTGYELSHTLPYAKHYS